MILLVPWLSFFPGERSDVAGMTRPDIPDGFGGSGGAVLRRPHAVDSASASDETSGESEGAPHSSGSPKISEPEYSGSEESVELDERQFMFSDDALQRYMEQLDVTWEQLAAAPTAPPSSTGRINRSRSGDLATQAAPDLVPPPSSDGQGLPTPLTIQLDHLPELSGSRKGGALTPHDLEALVLSSDRPERHVLRFPEREPMTPEEAAQEALWIYRMAFSDQPLGYLPWVHPPIAPDLVPLPEDPSYRRRYYEVFHHPRPPVPQPPQYANTIRAVLTLLRNQHLEIPYMVRHCPQHFDEGTVDEAQFWRIADWDERWAQLAQAHRQLDRQRQRRTAARRARLALFALERQQRRVRERGDLDRLLADPNRLDPRLTGWIGHENTGVLDAPSRLDAPVVAVEGAGAGGSSAGGVGQEAIVAQLERIDALIQYYRERLLTDRDLADFTAFMAQRYDPRLYPRWRHAELDVVPGSERDLQRFMEGTDAADEALAEPIPEHADWVVLSAQARAWSLRHDPSWIRAQQALVQPDPAESASPTGLGGHPRLALLQELARPSEGPQSRSGTRRLRRAPVPPPPLFLVSQRVNGLLNGIIPWLKAYEAWWERVWGLGPTVRPESLVTGRGRRDWVAAEVRTALLTWSHQRRTGGPGVLACHAGLDILGRLLTITPDRFVFNLMQQDTHQPPDLREVMETLTGDPARAAAAVAPGGLLSHPIYMAQHFLVCQASADMARLETAVHAYDRQIDLGLSQLGPLARLQPPDELIAHSPVAALLRARCAPAAPALPHDAAEGSVVPDPAQQAVQKIEASQRLAIACHLLRTHWGAQLCACFVRVSAQHTLGIIPHLEERWQALFVSAQIASASGSLGPGDGSGAVPGLGPELRSQVAGAATRVLGLVRYAAAERLSAHSVIRLLLRSTVVPKVTVTTRPTPEGLETLLAEPLHPLADVVCLTRRPAGQFRGCAALAIERAKQQGMVHLTLALSEDVRERLPRMLCGWYGAVVPDRTTATGDEQADTKQSEGSQPDGKQADDEETGTKDAPSSGHAQWRGLVIATLLDQVLPKLLSETWRQLLECAEDAVCHHAEVVLAQEVFLPGYLPDTHTFSLAEAAVGYAWQLAGYEVLGLPPSELDHRARKLGPGAALACDPERSGLITAVLYQAGPREPCTVTVLNADGELVDYTVLQDLHRRTPGFWFDNPLGLRSTSGPSDTFPAQTGPGVSGDTGEEAVERGPQTLVGQDDGPDGRRALEAFLHGRKSSQSGELRPSGARGEGDSARRERPGPRQLSVAGEDPLILQLRRRIPPDLPEMEAFPQAILGTGEGSATRLGSAVVAGATEDDGDDNGDEMDGSASVRLEAVLRALEAAAPAGDGPGGSRVGAPKQGKVADLHRLARFLVLYGVQAVFVAGLGSWSSHQARTVQCLTNALGRARLLPPGFRTLDVRVVSSPLAAWYAQWRRARTRYPGRPPAVLASLFLGRYACSPLHALAETLTLSPVAGEAVEVPCAASSGPGGGSGTRYALTGAGLLQVPLHRFQNWLVSPGSRSQLLRQLHRPLITALSVSGLDLNRVLGQPRLHGLLAMVPGLGPHRARQLVGYAQQLAGAHTRSLVARLARHLPSRVLHPHDLARRQRADALAAPVNLANPNGALVLWLYRGLRAGAGYTSGRRAVQVQVSGGDGAEVEAPDTAPGSSSSSSSSSSEGDLAGPGPGLGLPRRGRGRGSVILYAKEAQLQTSIRTALSQDALLGYLGHGPLARILVQAHGVSGGRRARVRSARGPGLGSTDPTTYPLNPTPSVVSRGQIAMLWLGPLAMQLVRDANEAGAGAGTVGEGDIAGALSGETGQRMLREVLGSGGGGEGSGMLGFGLLFHLSYATLARNRHVALFRRFRANPAVPRVWRNAIGFLRVEASGMLAPVVWARARAWQALHQPGLTDMAAPDPGLASPGPPLSMEEAATPLILGMANLSGTGLADELPEYRTKHAHALQQATEALLARALDAAQAQAQAQAQPSSQPSGRDDADGDGDGGENTGGQATQDGRITQLQMLGVFLEAATGLSALDCSILDGTLAPPERYAVALLLARLSASEVLGTDIPRAGRPSHEVVATLDAQHPNRTTLLSWGSGLLAGVWAQSDRLYRSDLGQRLQRLEGIPITEFVALEHELAGVRSHLLGAVRARVLRQAARPRVPWWPAVNPPLEGAPPDLWAGALAGEPVEALYPGQLRTLHGVRVLARRPSAYDDEASIEVCAAHAGGEGKRAAVWAVWAAERYRAGTGRMPSGPVGPNDHALATQTVPTAVLLEVNPGTQLLARLPVAGAEYGGTGGSHSSSGSARASYGLSLSQFFKLGLGTFLGRGRIPLAQAPVFRCRLVRTELVSVPIQDPELVAPAQLAMERGEGGLMDDVPSSTYRVQEAQVTVSVQASVLGLPLGSLLAQYRLPPAQDPTSDLGILAQLFKLYALKQVSDAVGAGGTAGGDEGAVRDASGGESEASAAARLRAAGYFVPAVAPHSHWALVTAQEAEAQLANQPPGAYLFRPSQRSPDHLAVSFVLLSQSIVYEGLGARIEHLQLTRIRHAQASVLGLVGAKQQPGDRPGITPTPTAAAAAATLAGIGGGNGSDSISSQRTDPLGNALVFGITRAGAQLDRHVSEVGKRARGGGRGDTGGPHRVGEGIGRRQDVFLVGYVPGIPLRKVLVYRSLDHFVERFINPIAYTTQAVVRSRRFATGSPEAVMEFLYRRRDEMRAAGHARYVPHTLAFATGSADSGEGDGPAARQSRLSVVAPFILVWLPGSSADPESERVFVWPGGLRAFQKQFPAPEELVSYFKRWYPAIMQARYPHGPPPPLPPSGPSGIPYAPGPPQYHPPDQDPNWAPAGTETHPGSWPQAGHS